MKKTTQDWLGIFALSLQKVLAICELDFSFLQEIRLRIGKPVFLWYKNQEYILSKQGGFTTDFAQAYFLDKAELTETLSYISNYSLYAFEEEIRQGFLTIQGGHRIGLSGKTVVENRSIRNMKAIFSLNVRFSHQILGCADRLLPYLYDRRQGLCSLLIISPPRCGKTTLLRDLIRQVSNGNVEHSGKTVAVVDERSEIAACYMGLPQNDVGMRTDILDACPKDKGMMMMIRSMSPEVLAVDELGGAEEIQAIHYALHCGCKLFATVHGYSLEDVQSKPDFSPLVRALVFQRYICLTQQTERNTFMHVYDAQGKEMSCW
ncbi:stage III sporulation protein AA [Clostridia bacterium]|nr:stage III sporulation protein AA [Clostridia bacterium]